MTMVQDYLRNTTMSSAAFKRLADQGQLELRPPFQRNPVWLDGQKSYLIDTILNGFPVPELYVQIIQDDHGVESHIVVDGQQRLTALLDYIGGEYSLSGLEAPWNDSKFDDLTPEQRSAIFAYNFIVRVLPKMPSEQIRAIFQRLNRNVVALSRQELRHATYWGEFITSMERLATLDAWRTSGVFTANEVRRMLDVEYVSELAIGVLHGVQNKKASLERWYAVYEVEYEDREKVENTFSKVLGEIEQLIPDLSRSRWSKKSDFYTLFLHLAGREKELPFSREERAGVSAQLIQFADYVDVVLRLDPTDAVVVMKSVLEYSQGVQRAASDLNNRRIRARALGEYISGVRATVQINSALEEIQATETDAVTEDSYDDE
jgi:hypothetical protein